MNAHPAFQSFGRQHGVKLSRGSSTEYRVSIVRMDRWSMQGLRIIAASVVVCLSCGTIPETVVHDGGVVEAAAASVGGEIVDLRSDPPPCHRVETVTLDIDGGYVRLTVPLPCDPTRVTRDLGDPQP